MRLKTMTKHHIWLSVLCHMVVMRGANDICDEHTASIINNFAKAVTRYYRANSTTLTNEALTMRT